MKKNVQRRHQRLGHVERDDDVQYVLQELYIRPRPQQLGHVERVDDVKYVL